MAAANNQTYIVCLQMAFCRLDSLNLLTILLVGSTKNSDIQKKSVSLFPNPKSMNYICITKYIHCFAIHKYTENFFITKLTTYHW